MGNWRIRAGTCAGEEVAGSYFRLIFPGGDPRTGRFFSNPDSLCADKTYTLLAPGREGLRTGRYQRCPRPFASGPSARCNSIIEPVELTSEALAVFTPKVDRGVDRAMPPPSVIARGSRLSGEVEAWTVAWDGLLFNQGTPPAGSPRHARSSLSGTYDVRTRAFTLRWTSPIVGGPFDGFTGQWNLAGTFSPSPAG